jgi:signal transduction histidine kinase
MLDRLQKAFEMQKSFVHHASHELRTPLSTMLAQTEAALNKPLSEAELKSVLLSLKEDQQAMIELTNSLLLISQYENINNTTSRWASFRIDELLYDVFASAKKMYHNIHISFQLIDIPENEEDFIISGNETLLKSAFLNLIKNAYTYSTNQTITISLQAKKNSLFLYFDNNGILLSTQEQERLFIPFFRGLNAQQKKGFGLGLSIVNRIIFLHRGKVSYTIYNELNRFVVQLPKS